MINNEGWFSSTKSGCAPSKWPKWFLNGGYSPLTNWDDLPSRAHEGFPCALLYFTKFKIRKPSPSPFQTFPAQTHVQTRIINKHPGTHNHHQNDQTSTFKTYFRNHSHKNKAKRQGLKGFSIAILCLKEPRGLHHLHSNPCHPNPCPHQKHQQTQTHTHTNINTANHPHS